MKTAYREIHHVQTEDGLKELPYPRKVTLYTEDAIARNRHFSEHRTKYVPNNEYEKFLANARLLN